MARLALHDHRSGRHHGGYGRRRQRCHHSGGQRGDLRAPPAQAAHYLHPHSPWYRGSLCFLLLPPLVWLWFQRPVATVMLFTILASFITPFLAMSLLYLNNQCRWVGTQLWGRGPKLFPGSLLPPFL